MKETHYLVKIPKHKLEAGKTKHFSSLKNAQKFIDKEIQTINKWYRVGGLADNGDEQSRVLIAKTHNLFNQVKPIPFEVDVPEYV
jgi:hypothetical protein